MTIELDVDDLLFGGPEHGRLKQFAMDGDTNRFLKFVGRSDWLITVKANTKSNEAIYAMIQRLLDPRNQESCQLK